MGDTYSAVEIRSTLRTFQEYLRDLIEAKFEVFSTKLRLFVNFCEKDDAFRLIALEMHKRAGDAREWFAASSAAGKAAPLPDDGVARLANQYKLLLELKAQRIDLRALLSTLFTGGSVYESLAHFREGWLESMQAGFQRLFARMEAEIGAKERVDLEALVAAALAAMPTTTPSAAPAPTPAPAKPAATEAKPAATPAPPKPAAAKSAVPPDLDMDGLVKLLDKTVKGAKALAAKVKTDLQTDVKILKLEISKHAPSMDVVRMIAEPLEKTGGKIAEVAAAIKAKAKK